jgi:hypothetical protein
VSPASEASAADGAAAAPPADDQVLEALRALTTAAPGRSWTIPEITTELPGLEPAAVARALRRLALRGAARRHLGRGGARAFRASMSPSWRG